MDKKFSERDIGLAKRYNIDLETSEILKNKQNTPIVYEVSGLYDEEEQEETFGFVSATKLYRMEDSKITHRDQLAQIDFRVNRSRMGDKTITFEKVHSTDEHSEEFKTLMNYLINHAIDSDIKFIKYMGNLGINSKKFIKTDFKNKCPIKDLHEYITDPSNAVRYTEK